MLSREQRITKKKDFDFIFSKGRSRYANFLGVKLVQNSLTFNRFGIIVSNKVSKSAVVRNLLRRRLYAQLFTLLPELKIGYDILVVVQPRAVNITSDIIRSELMFLFKGLRLYN